MCGNINYWSDATLIMKGYAFGNIPYTINFCQGNITILATGREHQGIASHQIYGEPPKQLAGCLPLIGALAPCQGRGQQLHLRDGSRVKAIQRFHRKGEEDEALTSASISSVSHLPLAEKQMSLLKRLFPDRPQISR